MLSSQAYKQINASNEFKRIKIFTTELQKVNLKKLIHNSYKMCFWLNTFNFLVLFAIIYKKEIFKNSYNWNMFLQKTYFNIGGYELSLYEIEYCILR